MPLLAYFRSVGAVLLALLLIAGFYLPTSPIAQRAAANPPVIRIHSERKLPALVVFDTTQAILAAPTPAPWDTNPPAPPGTIPAGPIDDARVRGAFARLPLPGSHRAASLEQRKRQPSRKYAGRRHAEPPIVLAARQGPVAWFGFRYW